MIVAKFEGRWVHVVRFMREVSFSTETGWFMVCVDFEKIYRKREHFKWIPATTRFECVREIVGE